MPNRSPSVRPPPGAARVPLGLVAFPVLVLLLTVSACDSGDPSGPGGPPEGLPSVALIPVVDGLVQPLFLTAPPGDDRLFLVEQPGRIRVFEDGDLLTQPFLDLTGAVSSGGERGLLGLAFHPDFQANGRFHVSYTAAGGQSRVERFTVSSDPNRADPASGSLVLEVSQPFGNHNGGQVSFGPDGYLYVGMGDGGGSGDPLDHGQNPATLLGSLLRIDVNGGEPYAIPAGNPFAGGTDGTGGTGGRPEIWAWGLRNPWRFSHDPQGGVLAIADVGQNSLEEINIVPADAAGLNFGWNLMEGDACYQASTCDTTGLTLPALTYGHGSGSGRGCSVTGGYTYRGAAHPILDGWYFYADFCAGWIRALRHENGNVVADGEVVPPGLGAITSFGMDGHGELYVVVRDGRVFRIDAGD